LSSTSVVMSTAVAAKEWAGLCSSLQIDITPHKSDLPTDPASIYSQEKG
jgi:hypothetical protein